MFSIKQEVTGARKPLGSRQQPTGTKQPQNQAARGASAHSIREPDRTNASTTANGACLGAKSTFSSWPTGIQPPAAVTATPWVLQRDTFVKPEFPATSSRATGPWQPTPGPSAAAGSSAAPAPVPTIQKPAPWRVHFSQTDDPLLGFHAAAPAVATAEVSRRPWRVRVSSIPEDNPLVPDPTGMNGAPTPDAGPGDGADELAEPPQLTADIGGEGTGGALPPPKPWHVQHLQESAANDNALPAALQLPTSSVAVNEPQSPRGATRSRLDEPTAANSSSRGGLVGGSPASVSPVEDRWMQDTSHPDGLEVRHSTTMALLEVLASPKSSQGSVLGNVVPAALPVGLASPSAAAVTTESPLELAVPLRDQSRYTTHMLQDRAFATGTVTGLTLSELPSTGTGNGMRSLQPRSAATYAVGVGDRMANVMGATGFGAAASLFARVGSYEPDPHFPSLTQMAADLQALRQDFVVMPHGAARELSPVTARSLVASQPGLPNATALADRAWQSPGQEALMGMVGNRGGAGLSPSYAPPTRSRPAEISAHLQNGGSSHSCGGDGVEPVNTASAGRLGDRWADGMGIHVGAELPCNRDLAQQGDVGGPRQGGKSSTTGAPRVALAASDDGEVSVWFAPLRSQLATELRQAREGMGEGATKSSDVVTEAADHVILRLVEPDQHAAVRRQVNVPGNLCVERERADHQAVWAQCDAGCEKYMSVRPMTCRDARSTRRGLTTLDADCHKPAIPLPQGAAAGPAEQVTEPFLEACGAVIHTNPEPAVEDPFKIDMPGPMTQLIVDMRNAREGLQMGLPPPARSPPLHGPAAEPEVTARSAAARHYTVAPTLVELWGPEDCEYAAREAFVAGEPRTGFTSLMPGEMTACQDAPPAIVGRVSGPYSAWDFAMPNPMHEATAMAAVTSAASTAAAATAAGPAVVTGPSAQIGWTSSDMYRDATAEPSLTQLIKGLREARQELRSPEVGGGGFPDSFRSRQGAVAPVTRVSSVFCVPPEVPCQVPALGALARDAVNPLDPRLDEEPGGDGNSEGSGNGKDGDVSFSELVRLLQLQKLSRAREAKGILEPTIEMEGGACEDVRGSSPGFLVGNTQTSPGLDVGHIIGGGFSGPDMRRIVAPALIGRGTLQENGGLHADKIPCHGHLRKGGEGSIDWEHEPEVTLRQRLEPGVSLQHREILGAESSQNFMAAVPISAPAQAGLECGARMAAGASVVAASTIPCREQLQQPDSPYMLGPTADVSSPATQVAHWGTETIAEERPPCASTAAAIAAAVAAAAAMPLPSQYEGSGTSSGGAWTGPASVLGPDPAQMDGVLLGGSSPSPGPSPDIRPAALLDRFGPSLMQRGGVTLTGTALTSADTADAGTHVGGGGGVAHPVGNTSSATVETPGPRFLSPTCPKERYDEPADADGDDVVGCQTPVTVIPEASCIVSRHSIHEYSGGVSCRGGKGSGHEGDSNRGGARSSKPAARKMDSRTPTLLSSQGRRKQRQLRRFTPILLKASLPAAPARTPKTSQKAVVNTCAGTLLGVTHSPMEPCGSQQGSDSCQASVLPRCKIEPEEACAASRLVMAFNFQRHQEQYSAGSQIAATTMSMAVDPSALSQSTREGLRHGQHIPSTGFGAHQTYRQDFQGYHELRQSSQAPAPSQNQGHGLMALLRPTALGSQHYHGCGQSQGEGALLCSSQAPSCAPFTLPVLRPEEIWVRRSQMPWAAPRSTQGFSACGSWGPGRCQLSAGANGAAAVAAGGGEDAMPVTPGTWLDGEESDDGMLDVEALVAAGRAAAGLKTPLPAVAAVATLAAGPAGIHPAVDPTGGVLHLHGGDGGARGEAPTLDAVVMEKLESFGMQAAGNPGLCAEPGRRKLPTAATEHGVNTSPKVAGNLYQRQQPRSTYSVAVPTVECIAVQDVAAAATTEQAVSPESQSQQRPDAPLRLKEAAAAFSGRRCEASGLVPSLAEATAALDSFRLADDTMKPVGFGNANSEGFGRYLNAARLEERDVSHQDWQQNHGTNSAGFVHSEDCRRGSSTSIGRGLLDGAVVIIDRCMPRQQAEMCAAAVDALGGRISSATHLKCGATAVVCEHSRASHWLAWGVHLLSPRSLRRYSSPAPCYAFICMVVRPPDGLQLTLSLFASLFVGCRIYPSSVRSFWHVCTVVCV
ncbi:hypothetical protein Vretifemale_2389 [Volvox reticuliferus]|nr:hypothetical protein Vretifemale_2389 [Volvox reticuliferus]